MGWTGEFGEPVPILILPPIPSCSIYYFTFDGDITLFLSSLEGASIPVSLTPFSSHVLVTPPTCGEGKVQWDDDDLFNPNESMPIHTILIWCLLPNLFGHWLLHRWFLGSTSQIVTQLPFFFFLRSNKSSNMYLFPNGIFPFPTMASQSGQVRFKLGAMII